MRSREGGRLRDIACYSRPSRRLEAYAIMRDACVLIAQLIRPQIEGGIRNVAVAAVGRRTPRSEGGKTTTAAEGEEDRSGRVIKL